MADSVYKTYLQRNLKKVISKLGALALKDTVSKADLAQALQDELDAKATISALNTVDGKVTTLIGSDTAKSVRTIANEELAAQLIPANAQEALDTLQEIAAWIQAHPADAAAMSASITALTNKLALGTYTDETTGETVEYATVAAYVDAVKTELEAAIASTTALTDFRTTTTGTGNVVTSVDYDNTTGTTTVTKGDTAVMVNDLIDLTDAEVDALFVPETPSSGD